MDGLSSAVAACARPLQLCRGQAPGGRLLNGMLSSFKMKSNGNQEMPVNAGPEIKR
jgi:hypothetical protein